MTCAKTQGFLAKKKVETRAVVNAKKETLGPKDIQGLLEQVDEVYAAKGKRVEHLDLRKARPDAETIRRLLIGPSGNLRAPTFRAGRKLIVGFDEATYRQVLG